MTTQIDGSTGVSKVQDGVIVTADIADLNVTPEKLSQKLTLMAAKTLTATGVDFTGIPSWAKKITVSFVDVSGVASVTGRIRVGPSSGLVATGYSGLLTNFSTTPNITATGVTDGLGAIAGSSAASMCTGKAVLTHLGANLWEMSGHVIRLSDSIATLFSGSVQLSAPLELLSLVAIAGSFDSGTVGIMYEG